ncbi:MAG: signal peptidase I [Candidatus Hydrogenedentes bacterium]|nr:signal peptidase I [Candidatus Hydrogenedentota bacterium]
MEMCVSANSHQRGARFRRWLVFGIAALSAMVVIAGSISRLPFSEWKTFAMTGPTMEPVLHEKDRVLVDRRSIGKLTRWSIIVFYSPEAGVSRRTLLQRVVALPCERVHIADGKLLINGEACPLPADMATVHYTVPRSTGAAEVYGISEKDSYAIVPPDHYFTLADNSEIAKDGRIIGWIPRENIIGRVTSVYWPPSRSRSF